MKRALIRPQPDLFENGGPMAVVPDEQRPSLVLLIQAMLMEITTTTPTALTKQESGNDENHA